MHTGTDQSTSCAYWSSVGLCSSSFVRELCSLSCKECKSETVAQEYWHNASYACDNGELTAPSMWCVAQPCVLPIVLPDFLAYSYAPDDPRQVMAWNCGPYSHGLYAYAPHSYGSRRSMAGSKLQSICNLGQRPIVFGQMHSRHISKRWLYDVW